MTTKPVWLLDVDGVLNAPQPSWGAAPLRRYAHAKGREWRITWAPALIRRIRAIHDSGLAEIVWCTTWCPDAHEIERVTGLPTLPRAWEQELGSRDVMVAKRHAARVVVDTGRRLVWTDDDLPLLGDELAHPGRTLLIAPSPRRGLQPSHLDAIEEFLTEGAQ